MGIEAEDLQKPGTLVTVAEAAAILRVSKSSLHKWRCAGSGPKYIKIGSRVRYRAADLANFVERHSRSSTSEILAP